MKNSCTVCIIDDDDIYKFTITKTLQHLHLSQNVITFSDGEEALEFFAREKDNPAALPDVILLDINMPLMDGFQFMDEFIKVKSIIQKQMSVFLVTSSVDHSDVERSNLIPEIKEYIIKPIRAEKLKEIIKTCDLQKNP